MSPWQSVSAQPDQLGESPFWHPDEQMLYWVDIPGRELRRANVRVGSPESWAMPQEPGCIAPARSGGLVIALRDGIYRARRWGGALELVVRFPHDPATMRFNDGKADTLGRLWAGTMYEPRDRRTAALYSIDCRPYNGQDGRPLVETLAGDATVANGLAWSPDNKTVYWANTPDHAVHAWDWDAQTNLLANKRVFCRFEGKPAGWAPGQGGYGGRPDGAAVDSEGNYWCAMFEGARLLQISPAGAVLRELALPVRCPTMPCFGGNDLRTLYLTSASYNRPAGELDDMPQSGHVLWTRVDVPGLPVNFFSD
ncbi:MAG: SMP-30/gluconolactonase/LRE family protein [Comamonadaceae bacterium]|nr:MAG: SMP-30/gluconolactonase/LRE family protein [Comamonadaceae bacterium]